MVKEEIHNICEKYAITDYSINSDGSIDVVGSLYLFSMNLDKLPLKFNIVHGHFYCYKNELTSLEGSPESVRGSFDCSGNNLTSLEGCPKEVCGAFYCSSNNLTSLKGSPEIVYGTIYCGGNPLESLEGYNNYYEKLYCDNKDGLILKLKRSKKLKILDIL